MPDRPQKIGFTDMCEMGVHGLLIYCSICCALWRSLVPRSLAWLIFIMGRAPFNRRKLLLLLVNQSESKSPKIQPFVTLGSI
jgi:hypothetical protein